ncbi:hypothetical protein PF008_g753 [Phytophthora fragariae]|uniref:Uncharacterized protein n=1 Tax=Phytophthora fragariae TaxID=53985 RepID=A0A6G0SNX6_9STRA|nr:hypothetical protein PF008_g753 [Phytophthora fragariae]
MIRVLERLSQQLDELLLRQTRVEEKLAALGANTESIEKQTNTTEQQHQELEQPQPKRARKRASKALSTVWFEWFTAVPRMVQDGSGLASVQGGGSRTWSRSREEYP